MEVSGITLLKLGSFLFWTGLYTWCSLRVPDKSPEWCSRVVTLLHGTVASIVGVAQCGVFTVDKCRLTAKLMPRHYALMVWSWGYFAFDLLWCLTYWGQNKLMLLHHASALFAINVYMGKDYTGCVFACTVAFMEVTNPLLQMRWFLRSEGHQQSFLYLIVEATYLTLFLCLRGILGTYLIFKAMGSEIFDKEEKLICLVFYFVSIGFIYEIIGYVVHKYKTKIGTIRRWMEEIGLILNEQH